MHIPFEEILQELEKINERLNGMKSPAGPHIEIIDRPELLKRLAITEQTAIRWGKKGTIPEIRIGSSVRYNFPEVIEALKTAA